MTPQDLRGLMRLSLFAALVLAACGPGPSTAAPGPTGTAVPTTSATASTPGRSPAVSAGAVGQTDTEWGRIWDTLPAGFPTIQGATLGDEAGPGPASAKFVVNGDVAKTVITSLRTSLEAAGFSTTAYSGPLEDGTYVLDLRGVTDDCKVHAIASPQGTLTSVAILYGAVCPHP